ncbi:ribonuclease P protein component [Rubrivirga sp.]|uniref:ribonuclease P protein component n=1 Tax=Rubrivirga sp. TaxID=1885344 RepID=UPI003C71D833
MRPNAFPRSRRLKRRRLIRPLFDRGRDDVGRVRQGTVMVLYRTVPREATGLEVGVQVGFAPGRRTTNAVRTRVRRLMRETFRSHQADVLEAFDAREDCLTMMVLYRGRDDAASQAIRRDLPLALDRLAQREIPAAPRASSVP